MEKCFFCARTLGMMETHYRVRWHAKKGARWKKIGVACTHCGETRMTSIESTIRPEPKK